MYIDALFRERSIKQSDAWVSLAVCLAIHIIGVQIVLPIFVPPHFSPALISFSFFVTILAFVFPLAYLTIRYGAIQKSDFIPNGKDLIVLLLSSLILFMYVSLFVLRYNVRVSPNMVRMFSDLSGVHYSIALISILFVIPLLEEMLFRKYVFNIFLSRYSISLAIILVGIFETFLHVGYELRQLFIIFLYSVGLTIVYFKTRLSITLALHIFLNTMFYLPT